MSLKRVLILAVGLLCACTKSAETTLSLPDPSLVDDSEVSRIQQTRGEAAHLLELKDYDGLEKLAATDRAMKSFLGSGMAPIKPFYEGISGRANAGATDSARMNALTDWGTARPASITAKIARAFALTNDAWAARGGGYADTVTQNGWQTFGEKLQTVSELLNGIADQRKTYPEWYVAINSVSQGLGEDKNRILARNLEAATLYPQMVEIYNGPLTILLPRWNGSDAEVLDYATKAADAVGGDAGDMLYARMAKHLWDYSNDINVFSEMGFSWPRVRQGMELILAQYPHSKYMANEFCVFAYQAQDHDVAHALFNYLGDHYMEDAWGSVDTFNSAQAWAR